MADREEEEEELAGKVFVTEEVKLEVEVEATVEGEEDWSLSVACSHLLSSTF